MKNALEVCQKVCQNPIRFSQGKRPALSHCYFSFTKQIQIPALQPYEISKTNSPVFWLFFESSFIFFLKSATEGLQSL